MSRTREEIGEKYDGLEEIGESGKYEVLEDGEGDFWIGQDRLFGENEYTLVISGDTEDFAAALEDAGLLPEEYQPDGDDSTRSPEDVAETWLKATDNKGDEAWFPVESSTEVRKDPNPRFGAVAVHADLGHRGSDGAWARNPPKFGAESVQTVDAADLPFSEVPTDD